MQFYSCMDSFNSSTQASLKFLANEFCRFPTPIISFSPSVQSVWHATFSSNFHIDHQFMQTSPPPILLPYPVSSYPACTYAPTYFCLGKPTTSKLPITHIWHNFKEIDTLHPLVHIHHSVISSNWLGIQVHFVRFTFDINRTGLIQQSLTSCLCHKYISTKLYTFLPTFLHLSHVCQKI